MCSQMYGPLLVIDFITAPTAISSGTKIGTKFCKLPKSIVVYIVLQYQPYYRSFLGEAVPDLSHDPKVSSGPRGVRLLLDATTDPGEAPAAAGALLQTWTSNPDPLKDPKNGIPRRIP